MVRNIWTVSNLLSISRVLFVLPAAYLILTDVKFYNWEIVSLILIASITDFLDGLIARRLNQVTELGKILDPVADKIAIAILCISLVLSGILSIWFCAIVILRDIVIMIGSVRIMKIKNITIQSNWIGKWTVTSIALYLLCTIILVDNKYGILSGLQVVTLIMVIISFISYLLKYLAEVRSVQK